MGASDEMTDPGGRLTTHVLDTANGKPAAGMEIRLFQISGDKRTLLKTEKTNSDGRCDSPLLSGAEITNSEYELEFDVGSYFSGMGERPFLGTVPVRFGISSPEEHYHVPLLVSPFGYSTYRGS